MTVLIHARQAVARALLALVVACASTGSAPPALTTNAEADLSARGLALICGEACVGAVVYIRDRAYDSMDPPTPGDPLSDSQREAIGQQFGKVQFVTEEEADVIHANDGVVFVVGLIRQSSNGLVEVEVSWQGLDAIFTETLPFGWDGRDWVPVNGETEVTVTTLD